LPASKARHRSFTLLRRNAANARYKWYQLRTRSALSFGTARPSNLGAIHRALGDTQAALAATRQAIAIAPEFAQAHSNLGNALEDQCLLDAALAAYRQAASLNPGFVEAHTNCANVLRKLGQREEATAVCERIIKHRPDSAEPYFSLGNVLKELCQPDEAAKAYRRALALRPDFAEAYTNLVFCHKQLNPLCDGDSLRGWNTMNCDSCSSGRLASNYSG
jgi:tetratricopeptide (TPR) repeat protein